MNSRVCIAVPTYRRQDQLFAVLHGLARLRIDPDLDVQIVVFDNDAARSGEHVVRSLPAGYPIPVRYEVVPEPGLSSVRNGELTWGYAHAEYLAMIDDDEIPEPQWLHELMRVRRKTGADVVVGPVPVILPDEAPGWFGAWRSAEMPHPVDGAPLRDGWTGNCLLHLPTVQSFDVSFDPTMNFSGGEDTLFFRQIVARGGTIAYASRATVWELMSADRVSLGFVVARHFRKGNTLALCDQRIHGDPVAIAVRVAKGCGLTAVGSFTALACALTWRNADFVRSACDVARGVGMIAGLFGVSYEPYRRQT